MTDTTSDLDTDPIPVSPLGPPSDDRTVMSETASAIGATTGAVHDTSSGDVRAQRRSTALAIGDTLNGIYRVDRFIARGGMGEVFEGSNIASHERVAIKAMRGHLVDDPKVLAMFRKEAQILTRISHGAIVQYRVFARDPELDLYYIVTDFIDGEPLSSHLDGTPVDVAGFVQFGQRLASGLQAAHELGSIHRDMSPDNILLPGGKLDRAKIIDFGIAKSLDVSAETVVGDGFAGKIGFVAPEQFGEYDRQIGPWTDVYSTALVLLALAQGRAPDMGKTLLQAIERRREGPDLDGLPPAIEQLLWRMLVPDPARRIRSMTDVLGMLDRIENTTSTAAVPVAELAVPHRAARRSEPVPKTVFATCKILKTAGFRRVAAMRWLVLAIGVLLAIAAGRFLLSPPFPQHPLVATSTVPSLRSPPRVVALSNAGTPPGTDLRSVLDAVPCAWLRTANDPAFGKLAVYGVAPDPAGVASQLEGAMRAAGHAVPAITTRHVLPMPAVRCGMIEALKPLDVTEPDGRLQLISTGSPLRQQEGAPGCGPGLRTALNLDIIDRDSSRKFILLGITPSGALHVIAAGPAQLSEQAARHPEKYQVRGNGEFHVQACYKRTGTLGLILIDGSQPIDLRALSSPVGSMAGEQAPKLRAAAAAGGWRTRSVFLSIGPALHDPVADLTSAPVRTKGASSSGVTSTKQRAAAPKLVKLATGRPALCQRFIKQRWENLGTSTQEVCVSRAFSSDCDVTYAYFGNVRLHRVGNRVAVQGTTQRSSAMKSAPVCRKRKRWLF